MDGRTLYYLIENGAAVRFCSAEQLLQIAEEHCRAKGTTLRATAPLVDGEENLVAAFRIFAVKDGDLSALFDFHLAARAVGLGEEARALILETQGEKMLAQIERLSREAVGCSLFYSAG
ncbi:MAG: hypothetical protein LBL72_10415 [Candidatus Accumulibacter sp.]|jgi:hypothetical protein|nr:hypothetical protein [Accumulibacter sp.]